MNGSREIPVEAEHARPSAASRTSLIRGYVAAHNRPVPRRHTGSDPFALPPSWLKAKGAVDLATPFNLVTNTDIIGGNSGSPMVNRAGEVVGLVFDGNIHSLGGDYGFDAKLNRTVAVHSQALLEALDHVYSAGRVAAEIRQAQQ